MKLKALSIRRHDPYTSPGKEPLPSEYRGAFTVDNSTTAMEIQLTDADARKVVAFVAELIESSLRVAAKGMVQEVKQPYRPPTGEIPRFSDGGQPD